MQGETPGSEEGQGRLGVGWGAEGSDSAVPWPRAPLQRCRLGSCDPARVLLGLGVKIPPGRGWRWSGGGETTAEMERTYGESTTTNTPLPTGAKKFCCARTLQFNITGHAGRCLVCP